jgi:hypothetical protein
VIIAPDSYGLVLFVRAQRWPENVWHKLFLANPGHRLPPNARLPKDGQRNTCSRSGRQYLGARRHRLTEARLRVCLSVTVARKLLPERHGQGRGAAHGSCCIGKSLRAITCNHRRLACACHDPPTLAFLKDAIGTIRCNALGRDRRNLYRIRPANWHPYAGHNGSDGNARILWRGIGGSLVHSLDHPRRLCHARNLGLRASPRFEVRPYSVMVSAVLCRRGLGGRGGFGSYLGAAGLINDSSQITLCK